MSGSPIVALLALCALSGCGLLGESTRDEVMRELLPVAARALVKAAGGNLDANEAVCFELDETALEHDGDAVYVICRAPRAVSRFRR